MTTRPVRLLAAVILAAGVVGVAAPARAATPGFCPDGNGVTVVVDYQDLGGGVEVRCAHGQQATGLAALENAGFTVAGTVRWGSAFVCRINGKPDVKAEPCVDTPPASAYWSYWHAPNGGAWTYSSQGVLARKPPLGSFEGWSFSFGRDENHAPPPGVAPVRPAPSPQPTGTKRQPATRSVRPSGSAAGTTGPAATEAPVVAVPPAEPASGTAPPSVADDRTPGEPAAAPARDGTGPPVGTIAGVTLTAVLVAASAVTARRRRSRHMGG